MYHSVIGKRLVACINRREEKSYTVREFFDQVYVPLFFSDRLLQNVNNSPFDQTFTKEKRPFTVELRDECLRKVHDKVEGQAPDASFYLGGPAAGVTRGTSGQVTSLQIPIDQEDVYASWLGAALGLTIDGGMTLLIDSEDVLLKTYDGWKVYRRYLEQTPKLKAFQINTWNGQWLVHAMGIELIFDPLFNSDGNELETQKWVQLLFALSYYYRDKSVDKLLTYVYSLGKSNKTLGFVRMNLGDVRRVADVYQRLFTVPKGMPAKKFEQLYNTDKGFLSACAYTDIGLKAIEPKDIFNAQKDVPKFPSETDEEKRIPFNIYQSWIIAMLKNENLFERALEVADALNEFQGKGDRGKANHFQAVKEVLTKRTKRDFIEALTPVLVEDPDHKDLYFKLVKDLHDMPADNVSLFLTLLRFTFAPYKSK